MGSGENQRRVRDQTDVRDKVHFRPGFRDWILFQESVPAILLPICSCLLLSG